MAYSKFAKFKTIDGKRRQYYTLEESDYDNRGETLKLLQGDVGKRITSMEKANVDYMSYSLYQYRLGELSAQEMYKNKKKRQEHQIANALQFLNAEDSTVARIRDLKSKQGLEFQRMRSDYEDFLGDKRGKDSLFGYVADAFDTDEQDRIVFKDEDGKTHRLSERAFDAVMNRIYAGLSDRAKYVLYSSGDEEIGTDFLIDILTGGIESGFTKEDLANYVLGELDSKYEEYVDYQTQKYEEAKAERKELHEERKREREAEKALAKQLKEQESIPEIAFEDLSDLQKMIYLDDMARLEREGKKKVSVGYWKKKMF